MTEHVSPIPKNGKKVQKVVLIPRTKTKATQLEGSQEIQRDGKIGHIFFSNKECSLSLHLRMFCLHLRNGARTLRVLSRGETGCVKGMLRDIQPFHLEWLADRGKTDTGMSFCLSLTRVLKGLCKPDLLDGENVSFVLLYSLSSRLFRIFRTFRERKVSFPSNKEWNGNFDHGVLRTPWSFCKLAGLSLLALPFSLSFLRVKLNSPLFLFPPRQFGSNIESAVAFPKCSNVSSLFFFTTHFLFLVCSG